MSDNRNLPGDQDTTQKPMEKPYKKPGKNK